MSAAVFLYQAAIVGSVWFMTANQGWIGYLFALAFWSAFTFFRAMTPQLKFLQGAVIVASAGVFSLMAYEDLLAMAERLGVWVVVGSSFIAVVFLTLIFNWLAGVVYGNMSKRIDDAHELMSSSEKFSFESIKDVVKTGALCASGVSDVLDTRAPVYLDVPYEDRAVVRELGAKWDPARRKWFVPPGVDLREFEKWR